MLRRSHYRTARQENAAGNAVSEEDILSFDHELIRNEGEVNQRYEKPEARERDERPEAKERPATRIAAVLTPGFFD